MQCTQVINFDAAHRVIGHKGNCKMLHGHTYRIEATFTSNCLDNLGMVIDFKVIKDILKTWLTENWDHNAILSSEDKELGNYITSVTKQKVYYLNSNPTAENMADYLLNKICPQIFKEQNATCIKIKLYESNASWVTAKKSK